jgi:hypothetical protein
MKRIQLRFGGGFWKVALAAVVATVSGAVPAVACGGAGGSEGNDASAADGAADSTSLDVGLPADAGGETGGERDTGPARCSALGERSGATVTLVPLAAGASAFALEPNCQGFHVAANAEFQRCAYAGCATVSHRAPWNVLAPAYPSADFRVGGLRVLRGRLFVLASHRNERASGSLPLDYTGTPSVAWRNMGTNTRDVTRVPMVPWGGSVLETTYSAGGGGMGASVGVVDSAGVETAVYARYGGSSSGSTSATFLAPRSEELAYYASVNVTAATNTTTNTIVELRRSVGDGGVPSFSAVRADGFPKADELVALPSGLLVVRNHGAKLTYCPYGASPPCGAETTLSPGRAPGVVDSELSEFAVAHDRVYAVATPPDPDGGVSSAPVAHQLVYCPVGDLLGGTCLWTPLGGPVPSARLWSSEIPGERTTSFINEFDEDHVYVQRVLNQGGPVEIQRIAK